MSARQRQEDAREITGRFGEQHLQDAGANVLVGESITASALKEQLPDRFQESIGTVDDNDVQTAVEHHPNDLDTATNWLRREVLIRSPLIESKQALERLLATRRALAKSAPTACSQRILQDHPDAATVELYNDDEDGVAFELDPGDAELHQARLLMSTEGWPRTRCIDR